MKIKRPPVELDTSLTAQEMLALAKKYREYDEKYYHYHQIALRVADKVTLLKLWTTLKFIRHTRLYPVLFADRAAGFNLTKPIARALSVVDTVTFGPGREPAANLATSYLVSQMIREEAISSSQLEGAATTSRVAQAMLTVGREPRNESESMIMGNWRLMRYIAGNSEQPLTTDMILKMHGIACRGINERKYQPGVIRASNEVYVAGREGEIIHQPPDFREVRAMLVALCGLVVRLEADEIHPLIVACILHFAIGFIHPFNDGNGRTARALFYYTMIRKGYPVFRYISVSKLLKNAAVKYGTAYLFTGTDELDLTYFIQYQCSVVCRAIAEFVGSLESLQEEQLRLAEYVESAFALTKTDLDILALALKAPGALLSAASVSERLAVSDNTARARLKALAGRGLLRPHKEGRGIVYEGPASVAVLKKWIEKTKMD
ncbi:Fic family protein [Chimaeribacter californicus]|uniref:Fic family protein n=1 Tax=Chimaeribacter californicus TaxID=2060067 RepID=A0A2N5E0S8_9GAMM|nr:Fic family protein [Chimaeribacter californicus]PLR33929.1 Fic family protein [Chimaeribacter californicus]